jgi:hypothetical protein
MYVFHVISGGMGGLDSASMAAISCLNATLSSTDISPSTRAFRIVCFCPRLMIDCDPLAGAEFLVEIVRTKTEIVGVHKEDFSHRRLGRSEHFGFFLSSLNSVVARDVDKSFTEARFSLFSLSN